MVKYFVYWVIVSTVPCTPKQPKPDEFGVVGTTNVTLSSVCMRTIKEPKMKEFSSRDSAFAFYEKSMIKSKKIESIGFIWESKHNISYVTIDSLITN